MAYDILIKNGTVVDGTGMPRYRTDVGIKDGLIVERGRLTGAADRVIDAEGLIVAPGLIDIHTHYDPHLIWDPKVTPSCWHGVTTIVAGNCGLTLAPVKPEHREAMMGVFGQVEELSMKSLSTIIPWEWESFGEYLDRIDQGLGVNVASFVGHNALRLYAMGDAAFERPANDEELEQMKRLVRQAMSVGACGWSTTVSPTHVGPGGAPVPSRMADDRELLELARVMTEYNRGYIEIIARSFLWGLNEADQTLLKNMALVSGRPVVWLTHGYKWYKPESWREEQAWMESASKEGASLYGVVRLQPIDRRVHFERTTFVNGLDTWRDIMELPVEQRAAKFRDQELRPALRHAIDHPQTASAKGQLRPQIRWEALTVDATTLPEHKAYEGRSVMDIAKERGVHIADAIADLIAAEDLQTVFRLRASLPQDDAAREELLKSPHVMLGNSDSGAHINSDCASGEPTYFLRNMVLDKGVMSLEEGIRRWTWVPASVVGLTDRGLIREGMRADLMMFAADEINTRKAEIIEDVPGGETRYVQKADGIKHVIVNGRVTLNGEVHTGDLPGKVLRVGSAEG